MLADASQFVEFSDYSLSEDEVRLAEFSAGLDAVVADDFAAIFNS
jgi:predicted nucleotide-binding protein (sugar kinase/HSP70/actin superfamily)